MNNWVCYLLMSLDTGQTYVGSTNNAQNRLNNHNNHDLTIKRRGAKRTRGQTWVPILIISGFHHKNACLSFESGWKIRAHHRSNKQLICLNEMCKTNFKFTKDAKWNRIMDLLFFINNISLLDTKFRINYDIRCPINPPTNLTIKIFIEDWIKDLPWPYFVSFSE